MGTEVINLIAGIGVVIIALVGIGLLVYFYLARQKAPSTSEFYTDQLAKAEKAKTEKNYEKAKKAYKKLIQGYTRHKNPPSNFGQYVGRAYFELGQFDRAVKNVPGAVNNYLQALNFGRLPEPIIQFMAQELSRQNTTSPQAVSVYTLHLTNLRAQGLPDDSVIEFLKSICQRSLQPDITADTLKFIIELSKKLIEADSKLEWAYLAQGISYGRIGSIEDAIQSLTQAEQILPTRSITPYYLGIYYFQKKDLENAYQAFRRSLNVDPNQPEALYYTSKTLLEKFINSGEATFLEEAASCNENACKLQPARPDYWFTLGRVRSHQAQGDLARNAFQQAVSLEPGNFDYQITLAELLCAQGDLPNAINTYQQAVKISPNDLAANQKLAELLYKTSQFNEAESVFKRVLTLKPNDNDALVGFGCSQFEQNKYQEAVGSLSQVNNHTRESLYRMGRSYSLTQLSTQALAVYERYLHEFGDQTDVYFFAGCALSQEKRWSEAIKLFEQAEVTAQNAGESRDDISFYTGLAYFYLGNFEQAMNRLKLAGKRAPTDPRAPYVVALIYILMKKWEDALSMLGFCIRSNPGFYPAHFGRGVVLENMAQYADAESAYQKGFQIKPEWFSALSRLGIVQAKQAKWADAYSNLTACSQRGMNDDEITFYLALSETSQGDLKQALPRWDLLLAKYPKDNAILTNWLHTVFSTGVAEFEQGNYSEAVNAWEKCLKYQPNNQDLQDCIVEGLIRLGANSLNQANNSDKFIQAHQALTNALQLQGNSLRTHYYLGLLLLVQGRYDDAEKHLQFLAKEDFEPERARYFLAISALQQGKLALAQRLLQELEPVAPGFYPSYQIILANLAILQQEWPRAFDIYNSILAPQVS